MTIKYRTAQLDFELARRDRYPAASLRLPRFVPQAITVGGLQAELAATLPDDPNRSWKEWELALAQRQAVRSPGRVFVRVIDLEDHNLIEIA